MTTEKDYYDILGVRPTAKQAEIELAYKGRRTQYHPDKYASADSDTLRWATAKMQEVNEAYTTLSDADMRRLFDSCRGSGSSFGDRRQQEKAHARPERESHPEQQNGRAAGSGGMLPLHRFLAMASLHDSDDTSRIYLQPDIPHAKIEAAIGSYARGVAPRDVAVLVDDTLFGGAKLGALITNDAIYANDSSGPGRRIRFDDIIEIKAEENTVIINDRIFHKVTLAASMKLRYLAFLVNEYIEMGRRPAPIGKRVLREWIGNASSRSADSLQRQPYFRQRSSARRLAWTRFIAWPRKHSPTSPSFRISTGTCLR